MSIKPCKIAMRLLDGQGREQDHEPIQVYLPFPDAEFGVQRSLAYPGIWLIVHPATSKLLPGMVVPDYLTRAEALVDANRLSVACPHASAVRFKNGKLTGNMRRLRDECIAALQVEAA